MSQIYQTVEEAFKRPMVSYDPSRQSLKAWVMFCLRDKGFKVVYAQNADFAIERKGEKLYFKVADTAENLDKEFNWVVWDSNAKTAIAIPAE
ncbi:hypothetical protein [Rivularia sp. UHCC 0363]|uniref:hypothetical protein n=1 Tax=Rivularia sp. UHCC 0363 TaxID=3110244 RepID=UPI002B20AD1C|nr:hypothetical protein [Rivularia sp. UHCC 0363]MEA5594417.1 hypothetical protein [Rivularia sp. UHCC 0363]